MFPFNKPGKKNISPANILLNLGKSPPRNKKSRSISPIKHKLNTIPPSFNERSYSISISPPKPRETNKPFTSHDIRESINKFYNIPNPPPKPPKLNLMKKLGNLTNNFKKTLENNLFKKQKPVFLDLGKSSSSHKNLKKSVGGKKTSTKKSTKKLNKLK
jgi:hypothetical protein